MKVSLAFSLFQESRIHSGDEFETVDLVKICI